MSQEVIPTAPVPSAQYVYNMSTRVSIWRIAAASFVGFLFCQLLTLLLYGCIWFGLIVLAAAGARR